MKQVFLLVMIFSLLTAVCGCSNEIDADTQQETSVYSDNSKKGTEQEPIVPPDVIPTVIEPPEEVPPAVEMPTVDTPEEKPSTIEAPDVELPEIEMPEEVPPTVEPPIIEPPIIEPPVIEPPTAEPPETEPPEVRPPITKTNDVMLVINELRTEFTSSSRRAEYIEFKVTKEGNLNGISVHIMNDAKNPFVYNFPNIDVALGEYITLHLQTLEGTCKDELGDNLSLSGGTESCPTARDLWIAGSKEYLNKTDIVYLQNASGKIIDAIVMNEKPSMKWEKGQSHFAGIVEYLCSVGAWEYEGDNLTAYDAVDTSSIGGSTYKSICRCEWRENHFNPTDWYITDYKSSFISPGLPNK